MNTEYTRQFELDTRKADASARTVPVVVSTTFPVDRGDFMEVLSHDPNSVDLTREPLPLIESHDTFRVNIGLVEKLRLDGEKLRGTVRFGTSNRANELWGDIENGIVRFVSVGYRVTEWDERDDRDPPTYTAIRWVPHEVSLVSAPADPQAGLNRSINMTEENTTETTEQPTADVTSLARFRQIEHRRRTGIRALFDRFAGVTGSDFTTLQDACLDDPNVNIDRARELLMAEMADGYVSVDVSTRQIEPTLKSRHSHENTRVYPGRDDSSDFTLAATDELSRRVGIPVENPHPAARDIERMRLSDIAEVYVRKSGASTRGMSREQIITAALNKRGIAQGTGHFSNLLENIASKSLLTGFMEAASQHRQFVRLGMQPDYKAGSRTALSEFSDLDTLVEGAQYEHGKFSDYKQSVQLVDYGKMFGISRQAIINDDLAAFSAIPRALAGSAARLEADKVYEILSTGTTTAMPDGVAMFHTSHSNYVTAGAAPSVATVSTARSSMAKQTGLQGESYLGIRPAYLIVPMALEDTARTLAAAEYDPAGSALMQPNPIRGTFEVVSDPRLDDFNASGWFMAADPGRFDTIELAFLDGQQTPYLESKDGWNIDGVEYKVRHTLDVVALDYRGLYYNDGVT